MAPLIVLLGSFLILLAVRGLYKKLSISRAGRIAFGVMLLFTGTSHFFLTEGMVMSMPSIFPAKEALVYFTGVLEILFGVGFMFAKNPALVAKLLIAFLVAVFPANVYAVLNNIDIENATYNGPGPSYLLFRAPLQLFFIGWVYYFGIHRRPNAKVQYIHMRIVGEQEGRVEVIEPEEKELNRRHQWD
jgi:uncharacterized membrane protein